MGLLSILRARVKDCMRLLDGQYTGNQLNKLCNSCKNHTEMEEPSATCCMFVVLSNEPDLKEQRSWLSEAVDIYPSCNYFSTQNFTVSSILLRWFGAGQSHTIELIVLILIKISR